MGMPCFWCGEKGHISRNCIQKEQKCRRCRRKGKVEKYCRGRNMRCLRCHKIEHRRSKCEMMEYNERGQREEEKEKREESYILLEKRDEVENQDYLEVIIDTRCKTSIWEEL